MPRTSAPGGPSELQDSTAQRDLPERLREVYFRLYSSFSKQPAPPVSISFYPYVNLKHTIRLRQGRILIRLSDILREAPLEVLESALAILLCKLLRRTLPARYDQLYRSFVGRTSVREEMRRVRGVRGSKKLTSPQGRQHDLRPLFAKLNRLYFGDRLRVRHLSWSPRKGRRVLGHYDPAHDAIIVNRRLDHPLVPVYVVEFILYHEMLHAFLGEKECGGSTRFHHPDFRRAERRFSDYDRAKAFIDRELC